ncbi:LytR/AlgR family response regulator transcription factor [Curvibacter sp. APW13]|uniref:LytR/AlgR family response regulator transcription factor n=1 Tax=Curvibacter sp. APW13 TaxID=3077236 RepID=UPI003965682F
MTAPTPLESMALRVLVVDDESLARSRLCSLLGDCTDPSAEVVAQAASATEAMDILQHQRVDVVLADIHMPGASGLALAKALRERERSPAVVFVTAHTEHAVEAFDIDAVDYLSKPVRLERLRAALQKVQRHQLLNAPDDAADAEAVLVVQERNRTHRIPLRDILYFKAELKYVTVRTSARSYIWDGALSEVEERFGPGFMRVHRNALVAVQAVTALEKHHGEDADGEGWQLRLRGIDDTVAVSRRQLQAVKELLSR